MIDSELENINLRIQNKEPESSAEFIIRETRALFKKPLVLFAGGKDSTTMLYIMKKVFPGGRIPFTVGFIDTGFQFRETYEFISRIEKLFDIKVERIENIEAKKRGVNPWDYPTFQCCTELKTYALKNYLKKNKNDAVFVGIRWSECGIRGKEKFYSWREDPPHYRVHPLLNWSEKMVWDYIKKNNIPYNPLYDKEDHNGLVYRSIGCYPCTKPTRKEGEERAGRNQEKEEIMEHLRALGYM